MMGRTSRERSANSAPGTFTTTPGFGGAVANNLGAAPNFRNCVFQANTASVESATGLPVRGGAMANIGGAFPKLTN
jgi:hypothetical protein